MIAHTSQNDGYTSVYTIQKLESLSLKISDLDSNELLKIAGIYAASSFFFWLFGFYSFVKIINGEGLAPFRLGKLSIPNFIHSSNIEVLIFCAVAAVALAVGFYIR